MIAKTLALFALVAAAQAGVAYVDSHVGAQSEQNIRSPGYFGGVQTVSSQSKAVDSAFSSVRRHETRVHNPSVQAYAAAPALQYAAAPVAYAAAPAVQYAAAPAVQYAAAPAVQYAAAPALQYAAAPVAKYAAAPVATAGLLGVRYSAVPQVAHVTYDFAGAHYAY